MQSLIILYACTQLWCVADNGKLSDRKRCPTVNLLYKFIPIHIHIENHTQSWKQNQSHPGLPQGRRWKEWFMMSTGSIKETHLAEM